MGLTDAPLPVKDLDKSIPELAADARTGHEASFAFRRDGGGGGVTRKRIYRVPHPSLPPVLVRSVCLSQVAPLTVLSLKCL